MVACLAAHRRRKHHRRRARHAFGPGLRLGRPWRRHGFGIDRPEQTAHTVTGSQPVPTDSRKGNETHRAHRDQRSAHPRPDRRSRSMVFRLEGRGVLGEGVAQGPFGLGVGQDVDGDAETDGEVSVGDRLAPFRRRRLEPGRGVDPGRLLVEGLFQRPRFDLQQRRAGRSQRQAPFVGRRRQVLDGLGIGRPRGVEPVPGVAHSRPNQDVIEIGELGQAASPCRRRGRC